MRGRHETERGTDDYRKNTTGMKEDDNNPFEVFFHHVMIKLVSH